MEPMKIAVLGTFFAIRKYILKILLCTYLWIVDLNRKETCPQRQWLYFVKVGIAPMWDSFGYLL